MTDNDENNGGTRRLRDQGPQGTVFLAPGDLPDLDSEIRDEAVSHDAPALVGLSPPFVDQWFRLQSERTLVGRKPHNDIVLDEPSVSFEHARIVRSAGQWRVVNLLSTNGTWINGARVHQGPLRHGDRVAFGNAAFIFATSDSVEDAPHSFRPMKASPRQWLIAAGLAILGLGAIAALVLLR